MKKLTAGIFATLLAVVSADGAYAAIASKGYVDDKVGEVETTVAGKADKATTLAGYGITDAYTSAQGTALAARVSAVEAPKAQVAADVTGPVSGGTVYTAIQGVSGDVSGVTSDVGTLKTDMAQAKEDISALEAASATHATQTQLSSGLAGKQDKLSQTGNASQPVYVNAEGKVTAGNTIPTVTTSITTGQTAAAQAGAVATALAAKADAADLADYVTKEAADAAYADIATETTASTASTNAQTALTNIGTLSQLTTEAKTNTVAAINEVAKEAADAATAAAGAKTAADTAQGEVDALEGVVNNAETGLAAAHTAIDALESGKLDKTATAARATADASGNVITDTYATKAEIADMATDENLKQKQDKTDNALNTTVKTVVGAINEVKTTADGASTAAGAAQTAADEAQADATQALADAAAAQEAADAAQATADAKQDKLTGTIGGSMQPVYLNNGTITAGTALGTLATKSTVTNSEVADGALAQSKINGLATSLAAKLTTPPTSERGETGLYVLTYDGTDFQWEDIARTVE